MHDARCLYDRLELYNMHAILDEIIQSLHVTPVGGLLSRYRSLFQRDFNVLQIAARREKKIEKQAGCYIPCNYTYVSGMSILSARNSCNILIPASCGAVTLGSANWWSSSASSDSPRAQTTYMVPSCNDEKYLTSLAGYPLSLLLLYLHANEDQVDRRYRTCAWRPK